MERNNSTVLTILLYYSHSDSFLHSQSFGNYGENESAHTLVHPSEILLDLFLNRKTVHTQHKPEVKVLCQHAGQINKYNSALKCTFHILITTKTKTQEENRKVQFSYRNVTLAAKRGIIKISSIHSLTFKLKLTTPY